MKAVVDASFCAALILEEPHTPRAKQILAEAPALTLLAPDLWQYEMANVIVANHRRGRIPMGNLARSVRLLRYMGGFASCPRRPWRGAWRWARPTG